MPTKILTVDDSKTIRMIVTRAFSPFACQITEAGNGQEGLEAVAKEKPDLMILDITMPVMDGVQTLAKLKENPDTASIPVIMLTAESGQEKVADVSKLGVSDYLVKPFKPEALVEKARKAVAIVLK